MSILDAILLGIIQGLTEFLPISSTAHLTLFGRLSGIVSTEHYAAWTAFIAVIQLGTLVAVLIYFFRDLTQILFSFTTDLKSGGLSALGGGMSADGRLGLLIIAGTIPIGIAGVFLSDFIHGVFTKNLVVIGLSLIVLALLLWLAEKTASHARQADTLSFKEALLIGIAQAFALIPGSSRSGTTLTAGLFLGLTRQSAARFSFLLSVPAVFASGVHEMLSLEANPFEFGVMNVLVATVVSAVSGYAAIAWLLRFLMKRTTLVFVCYRLALGAILLTLVFLNVVEP